MRKELADMQSTSRVWVLRDAIASAIVMAAVLEAVQSVPLRAKTSMFRRASLIREAPDA